MKKNKQEVKKTKEEIFVSKMLKLLIIFVVILIIVITLIKLNIYIDITWQNISFLIILSFILGGIYGAYNMHKGLHS